MTNTGGTPAGWYHAPGDPEGTQRYWDGAQWIGEPQGAQQQAAPTQTFAAPVAASPTPPSYGAPGAGVSAAPSGYQPYGAASSGGSAPADYGQRVVAYLIDWGIGAAIIIAGVAISVIAGAASDGLAIVGFVVAYVGALVYWIWNLVLKQGSTGQTIGKKQQGIKLIKDDTQAPVGGGMAFVRYLLAGVLSSVTCGIFGLLDILWPLWDNDKKRLTDKILNMSVVKV
ncbi:MAG: RDD family protein [Ilumatobacter sp.]